MPLDSVPAIDDPTRGRRFCMQFLGCTVAALALIALLNFIVNPMAQYPTECFVPAVQTSRLEKLKRLRALAQPPDGLVLGSSRVMKLEPGYLEAETKLRFFNAGVNYGLPEDHLALYRWYVERWGRGPKMVVVGIDVYSFSENIHPDPRLLNNPELARQIPEAVSWGDRMERWQELLAWQQTRESVRSLAYQLRNHELPTPDDVYRDDGLLVYRLREQQIAEGNYDFEGPLEFNCKEYEALYRGYESLSPARCRLFRALAEECHANGTRLVVYLTPLHPRLQQHLRARTTYEARRRELRDYLTNQAAIDHFAFFDATDIESFGGDAHMFVDGIHALEPNTRRLIDVLVKLREGQNEYAVQ